MSNKILTRKDILHLAKLSQLQLSDEQVKKYETQIAETLEYVKNLDELDTSSVHETSQTTSLHNVTFEDGKICERSIKKNDYFVVKKVL